MNNSLNGAGSDSEASAINVSRETELAEIAAEQTAAKIWPTEFAKLKQFHDWLVTAGFTRGLVGPREIDRMWQRHINNCAVISEAIGANKSVIDVGSGAGLPGLPLAIVRSDLQITLLEPLARRVDFLNEVISDLGIDNVSVVRGRAEDVKIAAEVVTSRAVAALPKLLAWSWPLAKTEVLAMKGLQAADEITDSAKYLKKHGLTASVLKVGEGVVDPLTTLVRVTRKNG